MDNLIWMSTRLGSAALLFVVPPSRQDCEAKLACRQRFIAQRALDVHTVSMASIAGGNAEHKSGSALYLVSRKLKEFGKGSRTNFGLQRTYC